MKSFLTFVELAIALICMFMVGATWGNTELVTAWTIATVGWIGAGFSSNKE